MKARGDKKEPLNIFLKPDLKQNDICFSVVCIVASIFIILFSIISILKFKLFNPTVFGWSTFYACSKIFYQHSLFRVWSVLPELSVVLILKPINYPYAFIYLFFPYPEAWFVFNTLILGSGAIIGYVLAKEILKSRYLAFSFSIAYLFHPVITTGAMLGFIVSAIGLPFFFCALYFLTKADFKNFIFFIILANLSDLGAVAVSIILGIILIFSKDRRKFGEMTLKISIPWFIIAVSFTFIYLKLVNRPFPIGCPHLDKYGNVMADVLRFIVRHPTIILKNTFEEGNLLIPLFFSFPNFLSFLSPFWLTPIIPEVIYLLIRNQHASAQFLVFPFIFFASIYGMRKVLNTAGKLLKNNHWLNWEKILMRIIASMILLITVFRHYYIPPVTQFASNLGPIPFTLQFKPDFYRFTRHAAIGRRLLKNIPSTASCLTLQSIAPHLSRCRQLGVFSKFFVRERYPWDYIFVDLSKDDFYQISPGEYFLSLKDFLQKDEYGIVEYEDGWLLLGKGYPGQRNKEVLGLLRDFETNYGIQ